jgi:methionyl aminopeptidase
MTPRRRLPDSLFKIRIAMRELRQGEIIYDYPVLKEVQNGIITQAEHTVIVKDEPIVTTK